MWKTALNTVLATDIRPCTCVKRTMLPSVMCLINEYKYACNVKLKTFITIYSQTFTYADVKITISDNKVMLAD